ncbi:MAG: protein kinase domain-containing protein [Elusimicrobiales bacterium]
MIKNGDEIGGYRITGELGRGGMGVVYRAHDKVLQRDAALKMVLPEAVTPHSKRRFLREAAAIARCDHPGIIKVYSFGEHEGLPYMAMEYVDGKPLFSFLELARSIAAIGDVEELKKYGYLKPLSPEDEELPYFLRPLTGLPLTDPDYESRAAALIAGMADALYEAHSLGILHRDIKPSNILISRKGPAKLADFGLAKFSDSSDITTGQPMLGTLRYMAPEAFSNREASPASDIYSLGTMLYELVTMEHPFKGDNTAAFIKAVTQDRCPPPSKLNPDLSPALGAVIMRCLEKKPSARYKDARELADAIRLAARPKGLKTNIVDGIKGLLRPGAREEEQPAAEESLRAASEKDRREAARLAGEAALAYFGDFETPQAQELVFSALKLDPFSVDATAMLIVLSYHMGDTHWLRKAAGRMRQLAKSGPDANERLYAGLLAEYLGRVKGWLRKMEHYLGGGADDPALLAICARSRMATSDHAKAKEYAERIDRVIPGGSLFTWFVEAFTSSMSGRQEESLQLTTETIKNHPDNIMLTLALAQWLTEAGRLNEAEKALNDAEALSGDHEFIPHMRAELDVLRGEYKSACVNLRKAMGAGSDELIAGDYYRLSKIYALRGDRKEALRHLEIARNQAPELNFKTPQELEALIEGSVEYQPSFESLPAECLHFNFAKSKAALLENLRSGVSILGRASATVYIFGKEGAPRAVRSWPFFNESDLRPMKINRMALPAVPLSSFMTHRGVALKTELIKTPAAYSRLMATITFDEPVRLLSFCPVEAQLDMEGLWHERHGGVIDLRLDEVSRLGHHCHILALPEDTEMMEISARADEEFKKAGWRFLVFRKFFYDCEHFRLKARIKHKRA